MTRNEVESARHYLHSVLILVGEIVLEREGPSARGGTAVLHDPWALDDASLTAERYSYRVSPR